MAEKAVQVTGGHCLWGWTGRDMPATGQALHVIGVGTVAWGAAVPLMSNPGGLWFAMGVFALAGLIPVGILHVNMFRGLCRDEQIEKLKEECGAIREELGRLKDKVQSLESGRAADRERIMALEEKNMALEAVLKKAGML